MSAKENELILVEHLRKFRASLPSWSVDKIASFAGVSGRTVLISGEIDVSEIGATLEGVSLYDFLDRRGANLAAFPDHNVEARVLLAALEARIAAALQD